MDFLQLDYAPLALGFVHVLLGVVVLVVAKLALGLLSAYSTDEETTTRDNRAFSGSRTERAAIRCASTARTDPCNER